MKRLLVILAAIALVATPAFAAVDSVKVSGDLTTLMVGRYGFNLNESASDDSAILGFTRVRIDTNLTEDVTATVRLLNERLWGSAEETAATTDIDLDLAYFTLTDFMGYPIELTVGRQEMKLGNGMLIGDPDTNFPLTGSGPSLPTKYGDLSMRKSFDAIKAVVDLAPVTLTLGYLKMVDGYVNATDDNRDTNAYVVNAAYDPTDKLMTNTFYVLQDSKKSDVHNVGINATYMASDALSFFGEYIYQAAKTAGVNVAEIRSDGHSSDYAITLAANYTFLDAAWMPTVSLILADVSRNWNPLYEDASSARIAQSLSGNANYKLGCLSVAAQPKEDLSLKLSYANLRLSSDHINTITNSWATLTGDGSKHGVGDEIDFTAVYDYTEDVQLGLILDVFMPGSYFADSNDDKAFQSIASMKIAF